ncbi:hypothetical protein T11_6544 [Trichinella zimbabwensis]|uniref:Uncharacterized protein n=1 Tax=Trichinella zimbabwensis TaxID=268475 RepID=A0A0V1HUT5_9BILA|nr:hypothetical protein T11_6544 [Trichinella zimbabwensis]
MISSKLARLVAKVPAQQQRIQKDGQRPLATATGQRSEPLIDDGRVNLAGVLLSSDAL